MNVRLAVQVLSESVSKTLIHCAEKKYDGFEGAFATAEFCSLMNQAFDILNCRSKFSKPFNQSISNNTIEKYSRVCIII